MTTLLATCVHGETCVDTHLQWEVVPKLWLFFWMASREHRIS